MPRTPEEQREWYAHNKDKAAEYQRRYRERHKEELRRKRCAATMSPEALEKRRDKDRKHYWSNPEKARERRRQQRMRMAPDRAALIRRKVNLKKNYGITVEQYDDMVRRQDNLCAICSEPPSEKHNGKKLHIDHDHESGAVRGLLCHLCNVALGAFRDRPRLLSKARDYLEKHGR